MAKACAWVEGRVLPPEANLKMGDDGGASASSSVRAGKASHSGVVSKQRCEMQIGDRIYDVTDFIPKHPGGNVLRYFVDQDVTEAFLAFHYRSEKAEKWLRCLPSRSADSLPALHHTYGSSVAVTLEEAKRGYGRDPKAAAATYGAKGAFRGQGSKSVETAATTPSSQGATSPCLLSKESFGSSQSPLAAAAASLRRQTADDVAEEEEGGRRVVESSGCSSEDQRPRLQRPSRGKCAEENQKGVVGGGRSSGTSQPVSGAFHRNEFGVVDDGRNVANTAEGESLVAVPLDEGEAALLQEIARVKLEQKRQEGETSPAEAMSKDKGTDTSFRNEWENERPLTEEERERTARILTNFRHFRAELLAKGFFEPCLPHVIYRNVEALGMFALSFFFLSYSYATLPLSVLIGGLASGRSGWLQHEGGHRSLTGVLWVDDLLQKFWISFGLITFNGKWNSMHNKHHAVPQKEEFDPDVDTLPFVAFYRTALERGRRSAFAMKYMRWWLRYQHISFLVITSVFNVFFWHFYLHPREYIFRKADPITFFFVSLRYIIHFYCASSLYGIGGCFWTLMMTMFVAGIYLFGNFSLNHTFLPTLPKDKAKNWVDHQLAFTANVDCSPLVNWWMGYLNCQIEHHLFPQMPQFRQPKVVPLTREFCRQNGLPYQSNSYWKAVTLVLSNLKNVAAEVDGVGKKSHTTT